MSSPLPPDDDPELPPLGPGHYTWDWSHPVGMAPEWEALRRQYGLGARADGRDIEHALAAGRATGANPAIRGFEGLVHADDNLRIRLFRCYRDLPLPTRRGFRFATQAVRTNAKGVPLPDHDERSDVLFPARERIVLRAVRTSPDRAADAVKSGPWLYYSGLDLRGHLLDAIEDLCDRERPGQGDAAVLNAVAARPDAPPPPPSRVRPPLGRKPTARDEAAYEMLKAAGDDPTPAEEEVIATTHGLTRDELRSVARAVILSRALGKPARPNRRPEE